MSVEYVVEFTSEFGNEFEPVYINVFEYTGYDGFPLFNCQKDAELTVRFLKMTDKYTGEKSRYRVVKKQVTEEVIYEG